MNGRHRMTTQQVFYILKCEHVIPGPASLLNGPLFCPWHETTAEIKGIHVYEWRAKCDTCRYARWAGLDKSTATIFATGHNRRNHGHRVYTEYTANPQAQEAAQKIEQWQLRAKH